MKKKVCFLLLLPYLFASSLSAQLLEGKITDRAGKPLSDVTIYIREIAQGIIANDKGEFQTTLKNGEYTFDFSSLGYERKTLPITISKPQTTVAVEMEEKSYALKEVRVSAKGEDPAYAIMRKAIAMAPFYLHQVKKYEAEVYMKGTIQVDKMPRYVKLVANEKELKNISKKLFLTESQSEVFFTAPNKYDQKVIAFSSTLPVELDAGDAAEVMTANIYDPNAFGRISPLSAGAFSYYKFTFEGITTEGDCLISKIRVQPKKKNPKLVTGYLYIIENSWNVQGAELSATEFGVTVHFTAAFNEVKPLVFLPTAYDIDIQVDVLGFKAAGKYYSSVQYKEVEVNEAQGVLKRKETSPEKTLVQKPETKKQQKARKQLETLSVKDELTAREAYKMAQLMQDAVKPVEKKGAQKSLELKPFDSNVKLTVDSLANRRDSMYWVAVRDLPLQPDEVISYQKKDSIKQVSDSLQRKDSLHNRSFATWTGKLLMGETIHFKKKYRFGYSGLIKSVPEYNFVDGFWIGQRLSFGVDFNKHKLLTISPAIYYTTARKALNWYIDGEFKYAPARGGLLSVSGGSTTQDFAGNAASLRIINSVSSLFFAENPVKFYERKFVEAKHQIDILNGFNLTAGFVYEKRRALENNISYSFFGGSPSVNLPGMQQLPMPVNTAMKTSVQLVYTHKHYYWLHNERKMYSRSSYPTLMFRYEAGIPSGHTASASFNRLELDVRQQIELGMFNNISYLVNAGKFLSSKEVYFPDYKHFNTNQLFVTGNRLENSFSLIDNYAYSTNKQWLQAFLNYTSGYLLIKHLPFLQSAPFNEALHARTLWLPGKVYSEAGYSIGFSDVGRIGVFVSFDKTKYNAVGFTISLPMLRLLEHK